MNKLYRKDLGAVKRKTHLESVEDLGCQPEGYMLRERRPLRRGLEDVAEIDTDRVELGLLDQDVARVSIAQADHVADHRGGGDGPRETGAAR